MEGQLVIALDDYHFVASEQVHRLVRQLLRHLPMAVHLAVTLRYDPPFDFAALRLRGGVNELRATELAFTRDEADAFLHGAIGANVETGAVEAVWRQTEGWAAGLRLAAISMRGTPDRNRFAQGQSYVKLGLAVRNHIFLSQVANEKAPGDQALYAAAGG